jgi:hypothetical protein
MSRKHIIAGVWVLLPFIFIIVTVAGVMGALAVFGLAAVCIAWMYVLHLLMDWCDR